MPQSREPWILLTEEISRYFNAGLSVYYYNITLGTTGIEISHADRTCAIDAIHSILFPTVEQAMIKKSP